MKFSFCFSLFLIAFFYGLSQTLPTNGNCKIKGRILDSLTRQPIDYATVSAFLTGTTQVAGGIITDEKGQFTVDNLAPGEYYIKCDFIGYTTRTLSGLILSDKASVVKVGDVLIANNSKAIKEVVVKGSRNFMENHIDKMVYNVEKDIGSQTGVATDVMKKIPQVSVDMEGNVELQGSQNVRVFINGKPSTLFDNNLAAALQSIPASLIKSIEVITSPGAQYDAQGSGGIINIILKDNKAKGANGSLNLSGGSRYQNGSTNLHIKNGNLDLNASLSGNYQLNTRSWSGSYRKSDSTEMKQNNYVDVIRNGYRASTGFDWAISKTHDINGSVSYNNYGNELNGSSIQNIYFLSLFSDTGILRNNYSNYRYQSVDYNLNYVKKFAKEGQELTFSYQESYSNNTYKYWLSQFSNETLLYSGAKSNNNQKETNRYFTIDYTHPFTKEIVLASGLKASQNYTESNTERYSLDTSTDYYYANPRQFDAFNFNKIIYAAYASLTFPINKHYGLRLGIREEATHLSYPNDTLASQLYYFLSPSAVLSRNLKNNANIKLSYSRRIQRPGFGQLNPFVDAADPSSLSQGNPYLLPQKIHSLELSYYKSFEKGSSIYASGFYRYSNFDWQGFTTFYPEFTVGDTTYRNASLSTTINAGILHIGGIYASSTIVFTPKLEIRFGFGGNGKHVESDLNGGTPKTNFNYRMNANATYKFNKSTTAEVYYNYNSARYEVQGKYPDYYSYNLGFKKQFKDNKASLSINASSPFNQYMEQTTYVSGSHFNTVSTRKYVQMVFNVGFYYKFGKIEFKETRNESSENEGSSAGG